MTATFKEIRNKAISLLPPEERANMFLPKFGPIIHEKDFVAI